jgi:putative solute:sodium symporter small subunit
MREPRDRHTTSEHQRAYWAENMRLVLILLFIWFIAAYAHPPFADALNNIQILTGFPLGYWLAAQGSLVIFVILIFIYALVMNNVIDPKYGYGEPEDED